jgi:hypothetical protein
MSQELKEYIRLSVIKDEQKERLIKRIEELERYEELNNANLETRFSRD